MSVSLLIFDDWFVNFDGGGYLTLARSLALDGTYEFPDSSFAAVRGPMYPATLAAPWMILSNTAKVAIWGSRAILVANALLVVWIVYKLTNRSLPAALGGVAASLQPLPLVSGGLFFVPDALAMGLGLAGLGVVLESRSNRVWFLSGLLIGLGVLAKETGLLFLVLVPLLLAVTESIGAVARNLWRFGLGFAVPVAGWVLVSLTAAGLAPEPFPLSIWLLLAFAPLLVGLFLVRSAFNASGRRLGIWLLGVLAVIVVFGLEMRETNALRTWGEVWEELQRDLDRQLYRGSPWILVLIPSILGVAWAVKDRTRSIAKVGLGLLLPGLALIVHAVRLGAGLRNGVIAAYGLSILVAWVAYELLELGRARFRTAPKVVFLAAAGLLFFSFVSGSALASHETNRRLPESSLTAHSDAVEGAAAFVAQFEAAVSATPEFASSLWFLSDGDLDLQLAPMLQSVDGRRSFDQQVWWMGSRPIEGDGVVSPVGIVVARTSTTAFDRELLANHLEETDSEYLVVTGNLATIASAFDGGILLPSLERDTDAVRVYSSSLDHLPQWVVVYRLTGPLSLPGPLYIHKAVNDDVPDYTVDQVVVDSTDYQDMIVSILSQQSDTAETSLAVSSE